MTTRKSRKKDAQTRRDATILMDYGRNYNINSDDYGNKDGVTMKDMINAQANQITMLERQFSSLKNRDNTPLKNVGSNLTGTIANTLHMLCDPGHANIVPFPGLDPEAQVKTNFTPATSLTLNNGLARVIMTPFGKYQVFISQDAPITIDPNLHLLKNPVAVATFGVSSTDVTTVFDQGSSGAQGLYCYNALGLAQLNFNLHIHNTLLLSIPEELIGGQINLVFQNDGLIEYLPTIAGQYYIDVLGGSVPGDNSIHMYTTTTATDTLNSIQFIPPANYTTGTVARIPFNTFYAPVAGFLTPRYVIELSLDNYYSITCPQLASILMRGENSRQGRFIAMSGLICSDASAISNNGFIYGTSIPQRLSVPTGTSFSAWISQQTRWYYKGRLATGMYQVYVPTNTEEQVFDPLVSSPWFGELQYNMVFMIDNSFSLNGAQLPDKTQAHVILEGVFSTLALNDIIDAKQSHPDPGWPMALALLRKYYSPCCNPDHKDEIAKWLKNVFNELINAGKDVITSPVTIDLIKKAASTALPIALSLI
jgi:hypothetical protein